MNSQISLSDIKGFVRRRKKIALTIFFVILFISVAVALLLPPIYQSSAMIMIEGQQIPEEYVKSTITTYAKERLEFITQQLITKSRLKEIIRELNLFPNLTDKDGLKKVLEEIKEGIQIKPISYKEGNKTFTVAFTLACEGKDPATVHKIAESLTNMYLQEEMKAREQLVSVTTDFLEKELETFKKQVQFHEQQISQYKAKHVGEMPENLPMNINNYHRLERELENINDRVRSLEERKIYLRGQLANIEPLKPVQTQQGKIISNPKERLKGLRLDLIHMQSRLSELHPDVRKLKAEIKKLEAQVGETDEAVEKVKLLSQKKAQLAELRGRLSPQHPDIKTLSKEIDILSKQVDKLLTEKNIMEISEEQPDNPAYINIMSQIMAADVEIKSQREKEQRIQQELEELQTVLSNAPMIEKEYKELTLDYNNAKAKYDEILNKLLSAQVAQQMEYQQKGEKFTLLQPPGLPTEPYKPNRLIIMLLGIVLAAGTAILVAAVQEGMDHSLKNVDELMGLTGVPVLSSISMVVTGEERQAKRRKRAAYALGTAGILIIAFVFINSFGITLGDLVTMLIERMAI